MDKSLGNVKVETIKSMLNSIDADITEVTFEFIVASLFPEAYNNMQNLLSEAHMQGYKQAMEEKNV